MVVRKRTRLRRDQITGGDIVHLAVGQIFFADATLRDVAEMRQAWNTPAVRQRVLDWHGRKWPNTKTFAAIIFGTDGTRHPHVTTADFPRFRQQYQAQRDAARQLV